MNGFYSHLEKRMHSAITEQKFLSDDSRRFSGMDDAKLKFSIRNPEAGKIHNPDPGIEQFDEISIVSRKTDVGLTKRGGIISVITDIHKRMYNQVPREKCKILNNLVRLIRGYESGSIALTSLNIGTLSSSDKNKKKLSSRIGYANNVLEKVMQDDVDSALGAGDIQKLTGCHTNSSSMWYIRSGLKPITIWRKNNPENVILQSGKYVKDSRWVDYGGSAYSGMAFLLDLLVETGKGAIVSKPKIGYMMAASLVWSAGKKINQYSEERKAIESCRKKHLNSLYKRSVAVLDHFL